MARPREFDEQNATEGAMQLFWRKGYQAASLNDLMEAMGLSKSSFYESFGTKRDVLLQALRRYGESSMTGLVEPLRRPLAGRREIEETFARMVAHALSPVGQRGCFVNNCIGEVAPHDSEILAASLDVKNQLQDAIALAVAQGQKDGTITKREKPKALARFLVNNLSGINLAAKSKPAKAMLEDIVRLTLRALD
jgi:TetR/AcrR family transcriptional repressor of nem operon